jgi:hypothetical protein
VEGAEPSAQEPAQDEGAESQPLPYRLSGIGDKTVRKLVDAGLDSVEAVAAASVEQLSEIPGIGGKTAEKVLAAAHADAAPGDAVPAGDQS